MTRILDGVRVLDLSRFLAGPHATLLLAGMGAEVIRIDDPAAGDSLSNSPVFHGRDGPAIERRHADDLGIAFLKRCRGKKSIHLDLKSAAGHELFLRLVEKADVVVENFSVGVTTRLGIDWPKLQAINPRLVHCALTGFGSSGPDKGRRGYDVTTQAMSGLMSITGQPDGPPMKAGSPLADTIGAGFAVSGILGALFHAERTGTGQFVDVSMVDVLFSLLFDEPLDCYEALGLSPRQGNRVMRFSPMNAYPTLDGWMVICCGTEAMWRAIAALMGRDDLAEHPDWSRMSWRVRNNDSVDRVMTEWTRAHESGDLDRRLDAAGVVASPVQGIEELLKWPHLHARDMIQPVAHPTLGTLPGLSAAGFPLKFSETETGYEGAAVPTGAQTREILAELLDLDDARLDALAAQGVI